IIFHGKPFSLNVGDRPAPLRWSSTALGNSLAGGGLGCGSEMADNIEHIRGYYEARGESEWHRLALPFDGALEWELHRRTFERLLPAGARVLGPFYHLADAADRARAARECRRVLRPDGWLFAYVMLRYAWLISQLLAWGSAATPAARSLLRTGVYRGGGHLGFTEAYLFHSGD